MCTKYIKSRVISIIILISCLSNSLCSQTFINREWQVNAGNPLFLQWNKSIISSNGELVTVGNTSVSGEGANLMLTKYNEDGSIAWTADYNTTGTRNEYGVDLVEDATSGDIYVCGTTDNGGITNYDIILLKYNSSGTLIWDETYNSPYSKNDIATSIKIFASELFIGAASEGSSSQFDFLTLKYDISGSYQWASRYDHNSLNELPVGIEVNSNSVIILGASATSTNNWDFTAVQYDLSGTFQGEERSNIAGSGYDQATAYLKDNLGNIYLTGKGSTNGINYDIKTIKLDASFNIAWNATDDPNGLEDQSNAIAVDLDGNVIVGGYATNDSHIKDGYIIKYDSSGNQIWNYRRPSDNPSYDASVTAIDINSDNEIIISVQIKGMNGTNDIAIIKLSPDGSVVWERTIHSLINEVPTGIQIDDNNVIYITYVQDIGGTASMYTVEKYTEFEPSRNAIVDSNNHAFCLDNQLIIRFQKSALKIPAINNQLGGNIEFGNLDYFLNTTAVNEIKNALSDICSSGGTSLVGSCPYKILKIFKNQKTYDSLTLSRLGDIVRIPDFWAVLILVLPDGMDLRDAKTRLQNIPNTVIYADIKPIANLYLGANDPYYNTNQLSLHPNTSFPNSDINIEPAWDIEVGKGHVKVGIVDESFKWVHEDFGYDGTNPATSKLNGWDFNANADLKSSNINLYDHGTKMAGIIGALRNNNKGIAGIAGGDNNVSNDGVSLFGLKVGDYFFNNTLGLELVNDAVVNSVSSPNPNIPGSYGVNILNISEGIYNQLPLTDPLLIPNNTNFLREMFHFANRLNVTVVASRGHEAFGSAVPLTTPIYPACLDEDWILNVSGSGTDGDLGYFFSNIDNNGEINAMYDNGVDISAPCAAGALIYTTNAAGVYFSGPTGVSNATAHTTGVASLLMSYINNPSASFDYRNLAPEDVEHILELSANSSADFSGWDIQSGFGRLDAGKALQLIEKPHNTIYHFGTNSASLATNTITSSLQSTGIAITTTEIYTTPSGASFPAASYIVDEYKVEDNLSYSINSNENICSTCYWPRHSSSSLLPKYNLSNVLVPRQQIVIDNLSTTSALVHGYVYKVYDATGTTFLGWWPFDIANISTEAKFELTILGHDPNVPNSIVDVNEEAPTLLVTPNPTSDLATISYVTANSSKIVINLVDGLGRIITSVNQNAHKGLNSYHFDLTGLSSGTYFFIVSDLNCKTYSKLSKK